MLLVLTANLALCSKSALRLSLVILFSAATDVLFMALLHVLELLPSLPSRILLAAWITHHALTVAFVQCCGAIFLPH